MGFDLLVDVHSIDSHLDETKDAVSQSDEAKCKAQSCYRAITGSIDVRAVVEVIDCCVAKAIEAVPEREGKVANGQYEQGNNEALLVLGKWLCFHGGGEHLVEMPDSTAEPSWLYTPCEHRASVSSSSCTARLSLALLAAGSRASL